MTKSSPKISVITPSYNSSKYLEQAIQSVLDQHYSNFEHIIIDGGSTDGTIEILKKYPHLKWVSESDKGQSDAMNKGFNMSSGDIIVYLNCDDYFLPEAFLEVVPYFGKGAKFVVGQIKVVLEDGSFYIDDPNTDFAQMLKWWKPNAFPPNPVGYFYLREVQEAVNGFNINNHYSMDIEFLLEASRLYEFTKINKLLGVYRYLPGTKTAETSGVDQTVDKLAFADRFLKYFDEGYVKNYKKEKQNYIVETKGITELKGYLNTKRYFLFGIQGLVIFFSNPLLWSRKLIRKVLRKVSE